MEIAYRIDAIRGTSASAERADLSWDLPIGSVVADKSHSQLSDSDVLFRENVSGCPWAG